MPSPSASGYGVTQPSGIDPFPIESTLASIVGQNNPVTAANMLDTYQIANQTSRDNYSQALSDQHDFARQQLQQQLYEAKLKALGEAKDPTVLQIMASAPDYQSVLGGVDRGTLGDIVQRARSSQDAVNYEKVGQGTSAFRAGGAAPDLGNLNKQYGLNLGAVDPTSVEAAKVNAAGRIAAAGASGGEPASATVGPNAATGGLNMTMRARKGETQAQFVDRLRREGLVPEKVQLPGGATSLPPAPGAPALPLAKQDEGTRAVPAQAPGADPIQKAAQDYMETRVRTTNPTMYRDVMEQAAKNGGKVQLLSDAKGNIIGVQGVKQAYTK